MTYANYRNGIKTIQTLMVASLALSMLIPMTGMNLAIAEKTSANQEILEQIKPKLEELKRKAELDPSYQKNYDVALLAYKMVEISAKIDSAKSSKLDQETIRSLETEHQKYLEEFIRIFPRDNMEVIKTKEMSIDSSSMATTTSSGTPWSTFVSRQNCGLPSSNGATSGVITGFATSSVIDAFYGYPNSITNGNFPNCEKPKNFASGTVDFHDVFGFDGCIWSPSQPTSSLISGSCSRIKDGDFVVITAQGFYGTTGTIFGQPGQASIIV